MLRAAVLVMALCTCAAGRQLGRELLGQSEPALSFEVSVGSGADARVRKSYVAYSPAGGASTYSVAQVEQGTVSLGSSSLTVAQAGGRPVQSIFVYRFKPGSISETEWAVNLQASAEKAQTFFVTATAASPTTGDLVLVGTYSGELTLGKTTLVSTGSFDIFVASVAAKDGALQWAASFGGAVGADAAYDVNFNPTTGEVLVGGAFSKNAVFGPDHAATASVNNVMQSQGVFVACMTAAEGAVTWVSTFPSDAHTISSVKLGVSQDSIYMGAAASGPFTVYANDAKLSIPKTGAGAVFVKLTFNGELDSTIAPATIMSVSNGANTFTLSAMGASGGAVYVTCTFVGKLLAGDTVVSQTADAYSNAAVIQMDAKLEPVWFTSVAGAGPQTADSLAVVPGDASAFVSGNAWSATGMVVTAATPSGSEVADLSYVAPEGRPKGAFVLQLAGASGAPVWLRVFDGYQEQASEIAYSSPEGATPELLVTGLFDRGSRCLALNSPDTQYCAVGDRPLFVASIPVSPTDTAAVERELESEAAANAADGDGGSSLSGGAIAGIVVGTVAGAALLAAGGVFLYKRRQAAQLAAATGSSGRVGSVSNNPVFVSGAPTAVVTTGGGAKA